MAIFEYRKYKIDIHEEKTKKFFDEEKIEDNQNNRNIQKYVAEIMSDEERAFFESLHIDLSKVNVLYGYLSRNKKWCFSAETYVIGHFVSYPETAFVTIDEVKEKGIEIPNHTGDNDIIVGNFKIHIYTPEEYFDEFYHNSDDIVENSIYLTIETETLPWLLSEKCKEKESSKFKEIMDHLRFHLRFIDYIPNKITRKRNIKTEHEKLIKELEQLKAKINIEYEVLSDKETKEYKKLWIDNILPKNASASTKEEAYHVCTDYGDYLWHLFSFELVETIENPTEEFNKLRKKNCTLIFEAQKFFTVKLRNAEDLEEQDIIDLCNSVAGWCDFVITADDFSWAYSRTHEDGWCGPYFYKKN